jgi:hypothetical protein
MSRFLWCGAAKEPEMRILICMGIVMTLAVPAAAQPLPSPAGSNMPPDFYPHPKCDKPDKSHLVQPGNDPDAMRIYNFKVKAFNDKATAFNLCIKAYIDNAQNDINTIQAIVHAAVADANSLH